MNLTDIFEGSQPVGATFVMFESSAGWTIDNSQRAVQRFIPASTFKIPNTLIALESAPGYVLSGRTGTADVTPTREVAWLVGPGEPGHAFRDR